uniref:Uncharacterized protein n=1 Tax=Anguilla anguilla TaxID=7936 RepID=A0A0E9R1H1_ANGAN
MLYSDRLVMVALEMFHSSVVLSCHFLQTPQLYF